MKLLPFLAGILIREAKAACDPNEPIIEVTCHADLMVQLAGIYFLIIQNFKIFGVRIPNFGLLGV